VGRTHPPKSRDRRAVGIRASRRGSAIDVSTAACPGVVPRKIGSVIVCALMLGASKLAVPREGRGEGVARIRASDVRISVGSDASIKRARAPARG